MQADCERLLAAGIWLTHLIIGKVLLVPLVKVCYEVQIWRAVRIDKIMMLQNYVQNPGNLIDWIYPGPSEVLCVPQGNWSAIKTWEKVPYRRPEIVYNDRP